MDKVLKEYSDRLRVLREQKQSLVSELRVKRVAKQNIDFEMRQIRADIKREKDKNKTAGKQVDQNSTQKTE